MGLRFSRRIKIAPGVRLNVGLRGVSVSAGVRGANVTLGREGLFGNVGLPGSGLSYRTKLAGGERKGRPAPERPPPPTAGPVTLRIEGLRVLLLDEGGRELPPQRAEAARREHKAAIADALRERAEALNAFSARQLDVHLNTPRPLGGTAQSGEPKPAPPPAGPGGARDPVAWGEYMAELAGWRARQAERLRLGSSSAASAQATPDRLEQALSSLVWPRETQVSFVLADGQRTLRLDVDLPEFDDLPDVEVHPDLRGLSLIERPLTLAARRRAYVRHAHGVLFRLVGEAFAALDGVDRVQAAGYTQRTSAATGRHTDEYVLDVDVRRTEWSGIDFGALESIDPPTALARFQLRRELSRSSELRAIPQPSWASS